MDELIDILRDIDPDVDYETCVSLMEDGYLTSFDLAILVSQINRRFGVSIPIEKVNPEYFNSAESIYALIRELGAGEEE